MKQKYIYIFFLMLITILLILQTKVLKLKEQTNIEENKEIKISLKNKEEIINIDLEDYVLGVLSCEMPALFEEEALKAGAVAARTYALEKVKNNENYIFKGNTSDQCYNSLDELKNKWGKDYNTYINKMKNIIKETEGQVITYNGKPIKAYYFSVSNGYTEEVEEVFKEDLEYLQSVASPLDINTKAYEKTVNISKKEFLNKLKLEYKSDIEITDITKTTSNRIKSIKINNKIFTGIEVRNLLNLRSTDFLIEIKDNNVHITTKGYGHGVGMSQYGANELAKEGYTYIEIIDYYYTSVEINNV